jgi:hypothetical protein
VTVAVVVAVGALATALPAPASAATRRCAVLGSHVRGIHHSRVTRVRGRVIVYRTAGSMADTVWACDRTTNRFVRLGYDETRQSQDNEYGADRTFEHVQIEPPWVIGVQQSGAEGAASCSKYQANPCPGVRLRLIAANVARGLAGGVATIESYATDAMGNQIGPLWPRVLVDSAGAIAWVQTEAQAGPQGEPAIRGCLAHAIASAISCPPSTLVHAALTVSSVALNGLEVTWTAADGMHSAPVG